MGKERNKYIHQVARTYAGQLGIRSEDWNRVATWPHYGRAYIQRKTENWKEFNLLVPGNRPMFAQALYNQCRDGLLEKLEKLSPERLGALVNCAPGSTTGFNVIPGRQFPTQTTMHEVHPQCIETYWYGAQILRHLASLSVAAAMADNILADVKKIRDAVRLNEQKHDAQA